MLLNMNIWAVGPKPPLVFAIREGLLVGCCLVAVSFGINYSFASRSLTMWLVDGGYHASQFVLFGIIFGSWR